MNNLQLFAFILILISQLCILNVAGKECTNIPTQPASQSLQATHHHHLIPSDEDVWSSLNPDENQKSKFDWELMYKKIKYGDVDESGKFLKEVSLHDVRIDPDSFYGAGQQTALEYLLMLDVDKLAWSFRKTAGLSTPGIPYGGWEAPEGELRGHFVGHYLSASALMWASTHNQSLYEKMNKLLSALDECQKKMGTGYLSAFPTEEFDRAEAIKPVWAPYYTIHKIMSGLLDQYAFGKSTRALKMVVWMADYFALRVQNVIEKYSIERHYASLNTETGGMNDVFYRIFGITGVHKYLVLGTLFDKPCFMGGLALQTDTLSGFHANTHIVLVVGAQIRYELTSDPLYKAIGTYFMSIVNSSHAYATGGTTVSEHWSDPKRLADTLTNENEETCVLYNMLKISRHLFRWTKDMPYADYYERALTNGILSTQRGREPGAMIYMLPLAPGGSKARSYHGWGTKNESFWCCYGTGLESFGKIGDSIYFEGGNHDVVYIIQYISSSFNWQAGGIMINQKVQPVASWDNVFKVTFNFSANIGKSKSSTLNFRIPHWADTNGLSAKLNGVKLPPPVPGSFLSLDRKWTSGDTLSLEFPMKIWTEAIQDDRSEYATTRGIFYGPYILAGLSTGDWDLKTGTNSYSPEWLTSVKPFYNSQLITLYQQSSNGTTFVVTSTDSTMTMEVEPESGTDNATQATFRVVYKDEKSSNISPFDQKSIEKEVMLEPFNLPGMTVVQVKQGQNIEVGVSNPEGTTESSTFQMVRGLDKKGGTVSFESASHKGCFLYSGVAYTNGTKLTVKCQSGSDNADFQQATSFNLGKGFIEYHPLSFVAKGVKRNFLLMPLFNMRDESYTVYFHMDA